MIDPSAEFYRLVRETVERNTGRPSYLSSDEEWIEALDQVVAKGGPHVEAVVFTLPVCPYCGSMAPFGDERHYWNRAHLESRFHKWWWNLKGK